MFVENFIQMNDEAVNHADHGVKSPRKQTAVEEKEIVGYPGGANNDDKNVYSEIPVLKMTGSSCGNPRRERRR